MYVSSMSLTKLVHGPLPSFISPEWVFRVKDFEVVSEEFQDIVILKIALTSIH